MDKLEMKAQPKAQEDTYGEVYKMTAPSRLISKGLIEPYILTSNISGRTNSQEKPNECSN